MIGTGTQGEPVEDQAEKDKWEKFGRDQAAKKLARRKALKDNPRNKLKVCNANEVKANLPLVRAQAEELGREAHKQVPTTMQTIDVTQSVSPIKRDNWPDQSTTNPRVCLSMMVKNEGKVLRRCLESVKGHVDEIVVVDTGSTDDTMDIAREFGAKVYEHPWNDSFSEGRNWAIYHTDCEWLLQLDADEELDKDAGPKIRDAVRQSHNTTINLIHMVMININENHQISQEQSVVNTGKLMRVLPNLHFTRRVHNKLHCYGDTIMTELKIYHYGYALDDKDYMKMKRSRTTELLHLQHTEAPQDPEVPYYLGIQYLREEDWDRAIQYSKEAIELFKIHEPHSQLVLLAHHVVASAVYHRQVRAKVFDFGEAIRYSEMALEIYPDYADSNSILSSIYFALKDYDKCEKYSERFLAACEMLRQDKSKSLVIPMNTLNNEWLIYLQLAINYFEKADSAKAIWLLSKSEDLLPTGHKHKPSFGVFKYLIMRGDEMSLKRAEAIYKEGFMEDAKPVTVFKEDGT